MLTPIHLTNYYILQNKYLFSCTLHLLFSTIERESFSPNNCMTQLHYVQLNANPDSNWQLNESENVNVLSKSIRLAFINPFTRTP